jgi:hypothetical protein
MNLKRYFKKNSLDFYKDINLVDDMTELKTRSSKKTELESKLKCGMLTSDVIDYFVHGKKYSSDKEKKR